MSKARAHDLALLNEEPVFAFWIQYILDKLVRREGADLSIQ